MVQGTQGFRQVRAAKCEYPTSCVVACIALGVDVFGGGPCPPLYILGGQGYMESPSRVLLESYYNPVG